MEHELLGKMVTWTSRGVVKAGEVIAIIPGYSNHFHHSSVDGKPKDYPEIGQHHLQKVVDTYKDSHTINFQYQKKVYNNNYGYHRGSIYAGLKKNTSFIIEVKHEHNPDHYKPKLFHPYPKNLRPIED